MSRTLGSCSAVAHTRSTVLPSKPRVWRASRSPNVRPARTSSRAPSIAARMRMALWVSAPCSRRVTSGRPASRVHACAEAGYASADTARNIRLEIRTRSPSLQRVEIRRDVAGVLLADTHLGHGSVLVERVWVANPANQRVRVVRQVSGDVRAPAEAGERRPDHRVGAVDPGDRVTGPAPILPDGGSGAVRIAAGDLHGRALHVVLASGSDAREEHAREQVTGTAEG